MVNALKTVLQGDSLASETAFLTMNKILFGQAEPEQIGALLIALQYKGESVEEIVGFVRAVRAQSKSFDLDSCDALDLCGTGGDGAQTFNISTTVAFVTAAAGQPVAKHGNRAVSSQSGSFDVLEKLNVRTACDGKEVKRHLEQFGLSFMFAPQYHPLLKNLAQLRRNLGVRTVFNVLGPLLNPAQVKRQLIGVYHPDLVEKVAQALLQLGADEGMVVRGQEGLDEVSLCGPTLVSHLKNGSVRTFVITPEDCGLPACSIEALRGGDATENAQTLELILNGEKGPRRHVVLLNAAAALVVGGKALDFKEGVARAAEAIDTGKAKSLLLQMRKAA